MPDDLWSNMLNTCGRDTWKHSLMNFEMSYKRSCGYNFETVQLRDEFLEELLKKRPDQIQWAFARQSYRKFMGELWKKFPKYLWNSERKSGSSFWGRIPGDTSKWILKRTAGGTSGAPNEEVPEDRRKKLSVEHFEDLWKKYQEEFLNSFLRNSERYIQKITSKLKNLRTNSADNSLNPRKTSTTASEIIPS